MLPSLSPDQSSLEGVRFKDPRCGTVVARHTTEEDRNGLPDPVRSVKVYRRIKPICGTSKAGLRLKAFSR
jgi:hypothetical protein